MSIFNLEEQNSELDNKIIAGLERLSQVFRTMLWEKAKQYNVSPIQIQLLIFIQNHSLEKSTVSYLSQEFNLTKPTISDAIKALEQKKLIKKNPDKTDTRSYTIQLTTAGKKLVADTENFAEPFIGLLKTTPSNHKQFIWETISNLIVQLNKLGFITVQRTCFNCRHFTQKNKQSYCSLLEQPLSKTDIRIDCAEFEMAEE